MADTPCLADGLAREYLDLVKHRVAFVDQGRGEPIVFLHGNPCWSHIFRAQIEAFRRRYRVLAPDLLGFGASAGSARGAGFIEQADMIEALLTRLDLENVHLVLHDWGGPIGLRWAVRHCERVAALVLVNTTVAPEFVPPFYWRPLVNELLAVRANVFVRGLPLALRAMRCPGERALYQQAFEHAAARRAVLRLEQLHGFRDVVSEVVAGLRTLSCPSRVLWGEPDLYFRKKERARLLRSFPSARCTVIPGAGHFPTADRPEDFNRLLGDFLAEPSRSANGAVSEVHTDARS